jgi:hypothetical protein
MKFNNGDTLIRITKEGNVLYAGVIPEGKFDEAVRRGGAMLDTWNVANPHDQISTPDERVQVAYMALEVSSDMPMFMILSCAMDNPNIGEAATATRRDLMAADGKVHMIIDLSAKRLFSVYFSSEHIRAERPKGYHEKTWHKDGTVSESWEEQKAP